MYCKAKQDKANITPALSAPFHQIAIPPATPTITGKIMKAIIKMAPPIITTQTNIKMMIAAPIRIPSTSIETPIPKNMCLKPIVLET